MSAGFENDHFQGGPNSPFQEMTSVRRAVSFPDHDMRMEHWFAILFHDVASEGENFDLFKGISW
jgi:hypothetical protein